MNSTALSGIGTNTHYLILRFNLCRISFHILADILLTYFFDLPETCLFKV